MVAHRNAAGALRNSNGNLHGLAGRGMLDCVVDEVEDKARKQVRVAPDDGVSGRVVDIDRASDAGCTRKRHEALDGLHRHLVEGDGEGAIEGAPGVRPGEEEKVFNDLGEALEFFSGACEELPCLLGGGFLASKDLDFTTEDGKGGLELVRSVRNETLLALKGALDLVEQAVEREGEAA